MSNIKNKLKRLYYWDYFPFVILFIAIVIFHLIINLNFGDDLYFKEVLKNDTILHWVKTRYMTWASRVIIEFTMVMLLTKFIFLWKIIDIFIIMLLAVSMSKLFVDKNIRENNWMITALMFVIPFIELNASAGWVATTLNYLWPLSLGLYTFVIIKKIFEQEQVRWYEYLFSILALLFGANQELMCAILLGMYSLLSIFFFIKKKSKTFILIQNALCLGSFVFILTCPGNAARKSAEIATWFPDYGMLTLVNKIELGFTSSMEQFIFKTNMTFIIFSMVIAIGTIIKYEDKLFRIISIVPFVSSIFFSAMNKHSWVMTNYGMITIDNFHLVNSYVPIMLFGIVGICSILSLYFCFGNTPKAILAISVLLLGFASREVMAFSPTIWASALRTFIFMYFSLIICSIMVCNEILKLKIESFKAVKYTIGMFSIIAYVNTMVDLFKR